MSPIFPGVVASGISGHLYDGPYGAYDALATVVVPSGGVSSVTFNGIPTGYKHLQVRASLKGTLTDTGIDIFATINGDTTSGNYYSHYLFGQGSGSLISGSNANRYFGSMPGSTSTSVFSGNIMDFLDYSSSSKYKTGKLLYGYDMNGSGYQAMQSILWKNTNPITSLSFASATGGNFQQYSTFALYGVK